MTTLPKFDRSGSLALWLQERRRRRLAPLLRAEYPSKLAWAWTLKEPHRWNVWMSLNGGVSWVLIEDYWAYGSAREFSPDGGDELYFIVGVNEAGNEITGKSNIIRPDDAPVPPSPLSANLVAYWKMDEASGGFADATGNSYAASDSGSEPVLHGSDGIILDASEGEGGDQYLNAPMTNMQGNFSISLWMKSVSTSICTLLSQASTSNQGWLICSNGGTNPDLNFQVYTDEDGGHGYVISAPGLFDGDWHHVVCVKDGLDILIYADGVLVDWLTCSYDMASAPDALTFFTNGTATWQNYAGLLDEVGIWERALPALEVGDLYNAGVGLGFDDF